MCVIFNFREECYFQPDIFFLFFFRSLVSLRYIFAWHRKSSSSVFMQLQLMFVFSLSLLFLQPCGFFLPRSTSTTVVLVFVKILANVRQQFDVVFSGFPTVLTFFKKCRKPLPAIIIYIFIFLFEWRCKFLFYLASNDDVFSGSFCLRERKGLKIRTLQNKYAVKRRNEKQGEGLKTASPSSLPLCCNSCKANNQPPTLTPRDL